MISRRKVFVAGLAATFAASFGARADGKPIVVMASWSG